MQPPRATAPPLFPPGRKRDALLCLAVAVLHVTSACGKRLDPLPPILVVPARPEPLGVVQEGSDVVVRFPFPSKTAQGDPLTALRKVTVYREVQPVREGVVLPVAPTGPAREREEKEFRARSVVVAELSRDELDDLTVGGDVLYRDSLLPLYREKRLGRVHLRYAVTATREKKLVSELSPIADIVPVIPPGRPLFLWATVEENRVCLDWLPPEEMLDGSRPAQAGAYAVFRKLATDEWYEDPIAVVKETTSYVDEGIRPGRHYLYTIRAAPTDQKPLILGPAADEVPVDTRDVFPPPAPTGFLVLREAEGVRLVWNPVLVPDLAAYRVYRKEPGATAWTKVADGLKETVWFDPGRRPEGTRYAVSAVDVSGNESPLSEEAK
ncbi:MAG: fibronectin type III domain-containing protein [Acidithiobacillales bacterium]